jgi:pimeloyl-ACP methyl ester carboxylesterase
MASLAGDIVYKLDSCARRGTKQVLLIGHSQGGAITYLLTAHLRTLQRQGQLPADVQLKTYCSAAPKPGNQYFAYEYEAAAYSPAGSWACNVVNAADWVPETPVSISYVYRQLDHPTRKAQRAYQKYLGKLASREVRKQLPGYQPGTYYPSTNYARTGLPIVLLPDAAYYQRFPNDPQRIFVHHLFQPYVYLAERLP